VLIGPSEWCAPCAVVDAALFYEERWLVRVHFMGSMTAWNAQLQALQPMNFSSAWPGIIEAPGRSLKLEARPSLSLSHILDATQELGAVPEAVAGPLLCFAAAACRSLPKTAGGISLSDIAIDPVGGVLAIPRLLILEAEGAGLGPRERWQPPLPELAGERDHVAVLEALAATLGFPWTWETVDEAWERTAVFGLPDHEVIEGWARGILPEAMAVLDSLLEESDIASRAGDLQRIHHKLDAANDPTVLARRSSRSYEYPVLEIEEPEGTHQFAAVGDEISIGSDRLCDISIGEAEGIEPRHLRLRISPSDEVYARRLGGPVWSDRERTREIYGVVPLTETPIYLPGDISLACIGLRAPENPDQ
jgi:hypothetical protein